MQQIQFPFQREEEGGGAFEATTVQTLHLEFGHRLNDIKVANQERRGHTLSHEM